jgi:hypothetical protein
MTFAPGGSVRRLADPARKAEAIAVLLAIASAEPRPPAPRGRECLGKVGVTYVFVNDT